MSKKRNAFKAGLFIFVSIALAFGVIVAIQGITGMFETTQIRLVTFKLEDDLSGLAVGDDVRIGGFKVGEVRSIELVAATDPRLPQTQPATLPADHAQALLLVTFAMPQKYTLREGTRLRVQSTVTEKTCLNIDKLGTGSILTPEMPLVGRPSTLAEVLTYVTDAAPRLSSIITQVDTQTVPHLNAALADVRSRVVPAAGDTLVKWGGTADHANDLIKKIRQSIDPILQRYYALADSGKVMMDEVRDVFGSSKTDFRTTVANLSAASGSVKEKLPGILDKADAFIKNIDAAVTSASAALEDAKTTMVNVREMTGAARAVVVGNKSKLDRIIASLETTSVNLKFASSEVRHSPWRLIYKPEADELVNINLYESTRRFAEGANELNTAAQALRDALKEKNPDPDRIQQLQKQVEEQFQKFHDIEQKLWEAARK